MKKSSKLAVDFAQQVVGIVNPQTDRDGWIINGFKPISGTKFNPSDINHVLAHITNWCDEAGCAFTISYALNEHVKDCMWNVELAGFVGADDDLCSALMKAALYAVQEIEAERKVQP